MLRIKFEINSSLSVLSKLCCGSHKVYLKFWVTGNWRIKKAISQFGENCSSPFVGLFCFNDWIASWITWSSETSQIVWYHVFKLMDPLRLHFEHATWHTIEKFETMRNFMTWPEKVIFLIEHGVAHRQMYT